MDSLRILFLAVISVGLTAGQVQLQPPGPLEKPEGDIVIVFCNYIGSGSVQPTWRDPANNVISPSGSGSVDGISVTYPSTIQTKLEITSIKKPDAGTYSCDAAGGGGSKSISITTYRSLDFINAPESQNFEIYTDAKVICELTSDPLPSYEWKFGTLSISQSTKYTIVEREYLQVNNISREDDGTYECQATVLGGNWETDSRFLRVTVLVPAKITLAPEDFNGTLGKNAEFLCIATGNPAPEYTWKVNNQPIPNDGRFTIENGGEKLVITDLQKEDVGSYMCIASIEGLAASRNAERSAFLNVFIPPVVKQGQEVIAQENEAALLLCNTVSGDDSELTWRRFGEDMPLGPQPSAADVEVVATQDGAVLELRFSSVKRSYNGSYECFAKNSGGEASAISNLTVHYAPVIDRARTNYEGYTGWIGNAVTMTCYWLANPPAMYYWRLKGNQANLTEPKFVTTSTADGASSVTFTPMVGTDFAIYQCIAYNTILSKVESDVHSVELHSAAPPNAPTVTILNKSPTTISLRVEDAEYTGGLDLTGYNITWKFESMGQDVIKFKFFEYKDENDDEYEIYVIEDLLSAKQYKIQVAAVNEYTMGEETQELIERTLATRNPYPPPITSDPKSDKEDQYTLTWEEPQDSGAEINSYNVQLWEYDPDRPNEAVVDDDKLPIQPVSKEHREYTFVSLKKATDYRLELWAVNSIGEGERTSFSFVTAGKKTTPTAVKTSTSTSVPKTTIQKQPTLADMTVRPKESNSLEKGTIIGIVIAAFLIVLIVVDISCCIVNDCGMTMCLCVHCCGRQAPGTKSHEIEMGEDKENAAAKSQQTTAIDETIPTDESTNQQPNSCDVKANGGDGSAAKGGKGAYSEIREDGDGSAPTEPPVEKDKLIGSETEQAPPLDEKTPMLSDQDSPAEASEPAPGADGDAKTEPPAAEPPVAEPAPAEAPPATEPEPAATETPAEPPTESTPNQNSTDEAKGELAAEKGFDDF